MSPLAKRLPKRPSASFADERQSDSEAHSEPSRPPGLSPAAVVLRDPSGMERRSGDEASAKKNPDLALCGAGLVADPTGAIYWPDENLLIVSDLHLEKGSAFAVRGVLLPPYDTASTLARLERVIGRYAPRFVIALGDSFHDSGASVRMSEADSHALAAMQRRRDWVWISGNHDPQPAPGLCGDFADMVAIAPLTFRHQPREQAAEGEVAGHLHPFARVARRGHSVSRRCFVSDGQRLIMPAFGAYTGGLNVCDGAITALFGRSTFRVHILGAKRIYSIAGDRCLSD